MKSFIVVALFVAAAVAAPTVDSEATVLDYKSDNIGVDGYAYSLQTSNGIAAEEQGALADAGTENEGIEVRGQFAYTGPDGVVYSVQYTAGREGFKPIGAHLPVAN